VAVSEQFNQIQTGDPKAGPDYSYLAKMLPDAIASVLVKSPYIQLLTRDQHTASEIEKQIEKGAIDHPDASPEEAEKAVGSMQQSAPFVVDGQYAVIAGSGDSDAQVQITAK